MKYKKNRIHRKNRINLEESARRTANDPHDPTYAMIDKHVSTPTSSFFGTMILQVIFLPVIFIFYLSRI